MSKQGYTLPQLRGAYAAGRRDALSPATRAQPAERRETEFAASELARLADKYGPTVAFSRSSDSHHWARCLIVNLAGRYGMPAVHAAFDEAERRMVTAGHDESAVGCAMDCLERREEDVLADMAAIKASLAEGARPMPLTRDDPCGNASASIPARGETEEN